MVCALWTQGPQGLCEATGLLSGGLPCLQQLGEPGSRPDGLQRAVGPAHSLALCFPFYNVSFESLTEGQSSEDGQPSEDAWLPYTFDNFSWGLPYPASPHCGHGAELLLMLPLWRNSGKRYFSGFPGVTLSSEREPLTQRGPVLGALGNKTPPGQGAKSYDCRTGLHRKGGGGEGVLLGYWLGRVRSMVSRSWVVSFYPYKVPLTPTGPRETLKYTLKAGEARRSKA